MQETLKNTWQSYTETWKTTSESERLTLLQSAIEPGCRYLDPQMDVTGPAALSAGIAAFQEQFPGAHFVTTRFWSHGRTALARWEMRAGDGAVLDEGASYAEFSGAGRLASITGYFDVPSEP